MQLEQFKTCVLQIVQVDPQVHVLLPSNVSPGRQEEHVEAKLLQVKQLELHG